MKKFASLLLAAALLATMLTVFAVPASAETVDLGGCYTVDGGKTVTLNGAPGTVFTTSQLNMWEGATLIIPKGVTLAFTKHAHYVQRLNIYGDNVTIEVYGRLESPINFEDNGIKGAEIGSNCKVNVYEGASINLIYPLEGSYIAKLFKTLPDPKSVFSGKDGAIVHIRYPGGGSIQITSDHTWKNGACEGCGVSSRDICPHNQLDPETGICKDCGYDCGADGFFSGLVLSEGNIWIIIAIVAVVVLGGVAAIVIVKKKKKPALADGAAIEEAEEETEE